MAEGARLESAVKPRMATALNRKDLLNSKLLADDAKRVHSLSQAIHETFRVPLHII